MSRLAWAPLLVAGLLAPLAHAQDDGPSAGPRHQLSLYVRGTGMAYASQARTMGGVGGGVGVRDTVDERYLLQADVSALTLLGRVYALRAGAGLQWRPGHGPWRPAVLLSLTALVGDRFDFLTPQHPTPLRGPAVSLGVSASPVRFSLGPTQLSLLELGVGVGPELPGAGLALHVGLVEVGASF